MKRFVVPSICLAILLMRPMASAQDSSKSTGASSSATPARVWHAVHRQKTVTGPTPTPVRKSTSKIRLGYSEAVRHYQRARHSREWWNQHFTTIVLVGGGYYYWELGYWWPAWGYDPAYQYYDYDGPIYTYGNLLPDQVIINVQRALQQLGYYAGALSGSLGSTTRAAIAAYQQDAGLLVTGVVDAPTVAALGLE
jgi:Putative peptidoglycan binding domain